MANKIDLRVAPAVDTLDDLLKVRPPVQSIGVALAVLLARRVPPCPPSRERELFLPSR